MGSGDPLGGTAVRLWFCLSFHQPLLGLSGAHLLDGRSELSYQDSTRQHAVDRCRLSRNPDATRGLVVVRVAVHQPSPDSTPDDWLDFAPDLSCDDSTQDHCVDAEHQATDLAVGGSHLSQRAGIPGRSGRPRGGVGLTCLLDAQHPDWHRHRHRFAGRGGHGHDEQAADQPPAGRVGNQDHRATGTRG
jgi:hypothetical protein